MGSGFSKVPNADTYTHYGRFDDVNESGYKADYVVNNNKLYVKIYECLTYAVPYDDDDDSGDGDLVYQWVTFSKAKSLSKSKMLVDGVMASYTYNPIRVYEVVAEDDSIKLIPTCDEGFNLVKGYFTGKFQSGDSRISTSYCDLYIDGDEYYAFGTDFTANKITFQSDDYDDGDYDDYDSRARSSSRTKKTLVASYTTSGSGDDAKITMSYTIDGESQTKNFTFDRADRTILEKK